MSVVYCYCPGRIHVEAEIHQNDQGQQYKIDFVKNDQHNHAQIHQSIRMGQMSLREQSIAENPSTTVRVSGHDIHIWVSC